MTKYHTIEISDKSLIVKEHGKQGDLYRFDLIPFFGDGYGFIHEAFKSFDEFIAYSVTEASGHLWDNSLRVKKVRDEKSIALISSLKNQAIEVKRKAWSYGEEKEWYKYLFFFDSPETFWTIVEKFADKILRGFMP